MWHDPNDLELNEYTYSALMISSPPEENDDIKHFIIKENNAYTEDNLMIYNIYVNRIPNELAEDDLRRYFSKFGRVVDFKFVEDKNISRCTACKVGFVRFVEPESACSALRRKNHRLGGSRICVIPAESWNQPNADKVCGPTENGDAGSSKVATAINGGTHMLSLNDYCIEAIFGYLELKEQVRFARVCERLQDIFQMHCKRKYKNLALSSIRGMTLWEIRDFFRFAGGNIASLTGTLPYTNGERIIEFIYTFCGKLNRIQVDNSILGYECLKKLLRSCPQLQELTLCKCVLNDISIQTMTHVNRLETLDLAENNKLPSEFISKLVQLKVLNLYGFSNIQTSHLVDICKSMPYLKSVDMRQCKQLSATPFNVMVEHCEPLEILKLSNPEFPCERVALLPYLKRLELLCFHGTEQKRVLAELVAGKAGKLEFNKFTILHTFSEEGIALISELKQLKALVIRCNPLVNDDVLMKFGKLKQLEEFTINGCNNITNQGLLKLVKSCQWLHHLDIQFCEQITIEFLLETIRFLKASGKRKNPLVLIACNTAMDYYDATKYEEFKDAEEESLISVVFEDSNGYFS